MMNHLICPQCLEPDPIASFQTGGNERIILICQNCEFHKFADSTDEFAFIKRGLHIVNEDVFK